MINFFKKTIISFLLVATLFYVAAPSISIISGNTSSVFSATVYAADETEVSDAFVMYAEGACGVSDMMGCIYAGIYFVTQFIHYLSTYASWAGGEIFDAAIKFAITGDLFDASVNSMIGVGWELLRDFANMFFIFIILYIAIATILQIGTYGGKDMLVKVIVAAVLINFSLLFTSMIIDASHILAWSFYDKINVQGDIEFPEIAPSIQIVDIHKDTLGKGLSTVTMAATGAANTFVESYEVWTSADKLVATAKEQLWNRWFRPEEENEDRSDVESNADKITRLTKEGKEVIRTSLNNLSLLYVMSSLLNFIIGFVFFAGAAMFIVRVLVLWVVMIFSPLGFVAPIMPKALASYASKWWDHLIKQAFFAPAFLFMFMLATELINSKILKATIIVNEDNLVDKVIPFTVKGTIVIIFQTMVIVFFLGLCLYVAKSMGAIGSDLMVNWGKTAGNWARNKVGDKAMLRFAGRNTLGRGASALANSDKMQRLAARMPIIGGGILSSVAKAKNIGGFDKAMEDRINLGKNLKSPELRGRYFSNLAKRFGAQEQSSYYKKVSARERAELHDYAESTGDKKFMTRVESYKNALPVEEQEKTVKARAEADIKKTDAALATVFFSRSREIQDEILKQMKPERKAGFMNKLHAADPTKFINEATTLVGGDYSEVGKNARKFRSDLLPTYAEIVSAVAKHKAGDVLILDDSIAIDSIGDAMVEKYNGGHVQKLIERSDNLTQKFIERLINTTNGNTNYQAIANAVRNAGNGALAKWIETNAIGRQALGLT